MEGKDLPGGYLTRYHHSKSDVHEHGSLSTGLEATLLQQLATRMSHAFLPGHANQLDGVRAPRAVYAAFPATHVHAIHVEGSTEPRSCESATGCSNGHQRLAMTEAVDCGPSAEERAHLQHKAQLVYFHVRSPLHILHVFLIPAGQGAVGLIALWSVGPAATPNKLRHFPTEEGCQKSKDETEIVLDDCEPGQPPRQILGQRRKCQSPR
mmetsp:Transcript_66615/g.156788  ORF Transcript_66615/g.156788 Transcript_66615/m.156788 type:complete len:209 (+) Transcript_66615:1795-2421(+)